jgi:N-acetylneuraminate lyase
MMLAGLGIGARGFVGSTYNIAAGLYLELINAFDRGDLDEARRLQSLSVKMVDTINLVPFHPGMKEVLKMLGLDCGGCRLPQKSLSVAQVKLLRDELEAIGFFEWRMAADATRVR